MQLARYPPLPSNSNLQSADHPFGVDAVLSSFVSVPKLPPKTHPHQATFPLGPDMTNDVPLTRPSMGMMA